MFRFERAFTTRKGRRVRLIYVLAVTLMLLVTFSVQPTAAQNSPVSAVPPNASLMSVSEPQADGTVTVSGSAGAVVGNTQVVVRNLYTGDTQYTTAGFDGSFRVTLYGPNTTPFWVSTARAIPTELRNIPGSLPGGPGTIVYGKAASQTQARSAITTLVVDGITEDWDAYPNAVLTDGLSALLNNDSLYVVLESAGLDGEWAQAALTVRVSDAVYVLRFTRETPRQLLVEQTVPTRRSLGARAANVAFDGETFEFRTSSTVFGTPDAVTFLNFALIDADGNELSALPFEFTTAKVPQFDGFTYGDATLPDDAVRFYIAGALGTSRWAAVGRANTLAVSGGDSLTLEMDVTFQAPALPFDVTDLALSGALRLQPVFAAGAHTNNGWSNVLTPSGLAIDNLRSDVTLASAATDWTHVIRYDDRLYFGLRFEVSLPEDLPDGLYVPLFEGLIQQGANTVESWGSNALFGASTNGISQTRLPIVLNVGAVETQRLLMTLLYDSPSDGSRGVIAEQDTAAALSNRVRFNSPTYILAPGTYPLEPYLLNALPNRYTQSAAPLIPFLWPGGRVDARVTRPDGIVDDLGSQPVLQNRLSTDALDERERFGAQSPIDALRVTTLVPALTDYNFSAYGEYQIELSGRLEDIWGNRYQGGGTYRVTIAEPLKLFTGVLSGTPFEVGDRVYLGARLAPSVPADVTVTVRLYPLNGGEVITQTASGTANRYGYFAPSDSFEVTTDGEYVIDYEARYTDAEGRLWAASVRSAGVVATPNSELIAHGSRGLDGYTPAPGEARPAWFNVRSYPATSDTAPRLNYPYFGGDVAVYYPRVDSGIRPVINVQDVSGRYAAWLQSTLGDTLPDGRSLRNAANRDSLPLLPVLGGAASPYQAALVPQRLVNTAYSYLSAVRAGVTQRQFVSVSDSTGLPLHWDGDDPLNGQIGAGINGDRVKDYTFLFGGALVKNAEIPLNTITIYAAFGVAANDEGNVDGARVYPPFGASTGASDAGPLLTVRGVDYAALFHMSGTQPGQTLVRGEPIVISGQAAPTLRSDVAIRITSPSGEVYTFNGQTNAIGYYFDPASIVTADEIGVWQVTVTTTPAAVTSAGVVIPPLPQGSVIGSGASQTFAVYVTLEDAPALTWNRGGNINDRVTPGSPINFAVNIPQGWTDITAYRTVTMPGYILEDGTLRATSPIAYQYSPSQLALEFTNLEIEPRATSAAASDVITITFAIVGTNAEGRRDVAVRSFTVSQDKLYSFEKE